MMKLLLVATAICMPSTALAQYSLGNMEDRTVAMCASGQLPGHPAYPQTFCACWVQTWVHLWNDDDFQQWQAGHSATQHMAAVETPAAQQCGGYPQ